VKKIHLPLLFVLLFLIGLTLSLSPWQTEDHTKQIKASLKKSGRGLVNQEGQVKEIDFLSKDVDLSAKGLEDIYRHTLFLPERKPPAHQAANGVVKQSASYDFELTGAGRLGTKEFAVIVAKPKRSRRMGYTRKIKNHSNVSKKPVKEREGQSHIYRIGDQVAESGYKLVSIHFGKRSSMITKLHEGTHVVLRKGSESIRIYLDNNDRASLDRDKQATKSKKTEKAEETKKPEELVIDENMPPPPPPPPISVGDLDLLLKGKSKKIDPERIKRLEKLRKNLLKQSEARKARAGRKK
jgi:hypothetical protein